MMEMATTENTATLEFCKHLAFILRRITQQDEHSKGLPIPVEVDAVLNQLLGEEEVQSNQQNQ